MEAKPRKPKKKEYTAGQVTFRLTPEIKARVWAMAERLQITPSELVRALLNTQVDMWEKLFDETGLADARPSTRREAEATFGRMLLLLSDMYSKILNESYDDHGNLKPLNRRG